MAQTREALGGPALGTPLVCAPRARRSAGTTGLLLDGRYRLQQRRTRDGSSSTWEGLDDQLGRPVWVRVVAGRTAGPTIAAAQRSAVLEDVRLARVLDVGTCLDGDGSSLGWVVTERAAGRPLADVLRAAPMSAARARTVVARTAEALARAASLGLHHRRLDPSSVLVSDAGDVTVLDLEVAAAAAGLAPVVSQRAEREDALGLVRLMYACLTGLWPQGRFGALGAAPATGGVPVPPSALVSGVPDDLDDLIVACLGFDDDGPRTPADLADTLARAAAAPAPGFSAPAPRRSPDADRALDDGVGELADDAAHDPADGLASTAPYVPVFTDPAFSDAAFTDPVFTDPVTDHSVTASPDREVPDAGPLAEPAAREGSADLGWSAAWDDTGRWDDPWHSPVPPAVASTPTVRGTGGRGRRVLAALLVTSLLALVLLAGVNLRTIGRVLGFSSAAAVAVHGATATQAPSGAAAGAPAPTAAVHIVAARPLDPLGDGSENDAQAPRAIDGDPATAWSSSTYSTAAFGGLKHGLGLQLDLGAGSTVHTVDVLVAGTGGTMDVRESPDGTFAHSTVLATTAVGSGSPGPVHVVLPHPATTRYLVLWFTALPASVSGHGYSAQVADVSVS